ncbi:MAG: alpha/beta hydrolase [Pseudomonadota bacterium]
MRQSIAERFSDPAAFGIPLPGNADAQPPRLFRDAKKRQIGRCLAYRIDPAHQTGPEQTVLCVHGWASRGFHLGAFVPPLIRQGWSVEVIDLPGHGANSKENLPIDDAVTSVAEVIRVVRPGGVIAHSFGAAVTSAVVAVMEAAWPRLALIAPPESLAATAEAFCQRTGASSAEREELMADLSRRCHGKLDHMVPGRLLSSYNEAVRWYLSSDDEVVGTYHLTPDRDTVDQSLQVYDGLGHHGLLTSRAVIRDVTSFIAGQCG